MSRTTKVFSKTLDAVSAVPPPRYVVEEGGTRSGKTFAVLQLLDMMVERKDRAGDVTSVVSETLPHLKKGAIRDFEAVRGTVLKYDPCWNESDHVYTYPNGGKLEFFSADDPTKVQGPARKRLFLNEAIHMKYDTFRQLAVRTSGIIFMDYNPEYRSWIQDKIQPRSNCVTIHSTYRDNDYLSPEQVAEIESNRDDAGWWRVYGEGKVGQLDGLIFPDFVQVDDMPEVSDGMTESYGLDYGFTNDPTALVRCLTDSRRRELWWDERLYRIGMLNQDIAAFMRQDGIGRAVRIYADSAEPKTNEELRRYGFNVIGSYKSTRKAEQLQALKGYRLHVTKRSVNMLRELRAYVWQTAPDGKMLNEPVGIMDHTIDAARYGSFPNLMPQRVNRTSISRT